MKKSLLLIAIALFGFTTMQAQEYVMFGAKGGVNFSTFSGDGVNAFNDPDGRTSFHLGLIAEIPLSERFSIQPEVLYSGQGYDIADRNNANDIEYQLDYINVPVIAKVYLTEGLALEAGPQVGFLVNSEIDGNPSSTNDEFSVSLDEEQFNTVDFSVALGASYKFRGGFFVNGRYNIGLTDIYDDSFRNNIFSGADAKHSVIQAGIGFMF
ncbi:PorT family protein [Antarcticibacterium flavum]|uniref:PorT family protein n=1 Tax=Antarcticibacterium flavum TaxID=2058175 RepID=A0A5B7X0W5_9FLAO|nr:MULTISPECIES: porin family protein [Antarcticibacterium]MCM4161190.1 PorT family protein [Antarcticibacterium sp. W02-3]QCY68308.1 PorT family protein [Antarcticibacterium flavum]